MRHSRPRLGTTSRDRQKQMQNLTGDAHIQPRARQHWVPTQKLHWRWAHHLKLQKYKETIHHEWESANTTGLEPPRTWDNRTILGLRADHPRICHNGILNILIIPNKSYTRNGQCKRNTLDTLLSVSLKAGNKSLKQKVHSLHLEVEGHPYRQREEIQAEKSTSKPCYFFNLLP